MRISIEIDTRDTGNEIGFNQYPSDEEMDLIRDILRLDRPLDSLPGNIAAHLCDTKESGPVDDLPVGC